MAGLLEHIRRRLAFLTGRTLAVDEESGSVLRGVTRLEHYTANEFAVHSHLHWFRDAVDDVIQSMQLDEARIGITRIEVYKELFSKNSFGVIQERRGVVVYGPSPTLYLTPEGLYNPRIRFEEVAHSIERPLGFAISDANQQRILCEYVQHLQQLYHQNHTPARVWAPICCHLDIYRAFLSSNAYDDPNCMLVDKVFAAEVARTLQSKCRRFSNPNGCHCEGV